MGTKPRHAASVYIIESIRGEGRGWKKRLKMETIRADKLLGAFKKNQKSRGVKYCREREQIKAEVFYRVGRYISDKLYKY